MQRAREWNRFSYMLQPADPSHHAFNAHAEAAVRHASVLAQIEIPLERLFRQSVLANARQQQIVRPNALRSADDFAVSLWREDVHAQRQFRSLRIRLHVKSFYLRRISMHNYRLFKLRRKISFVGRAEIAAPFKL